MNEARHDFGILHLVYDITGKFKPGRSARGVWVQINLRLMSRMEAAFRNFLLAYWNTLSH